VAFVAFVDFVDFVDLGFLIVTGSSKELTNSEHIKIGAFKGQKEKSDWLL
jgi:hypothetical protein